MLSHLKLFFESNKNNKKGENVDNTLQYPAEVAKQFTEYEIQVSGFITSTISAKAQIIF